MSEKLVLFLRGLPEFKSDDLRNKFFEEIGGNPKISVHEDGFLLSYSAEVLAEAAFKTLRDLNETQKDISVTYYDPPAPVAEPSLATVAEKMETQEAANEETEKNSNGKDSEVLPIKIAVTESSENTSNAVEAAPKIADAEEEPAEAEEEPAEVEEEPAEDGDMRREWLDECEDSTPPEHFLTLPPHEKVPDEIYRPMEYIPPTPEIIANIGHALWTHPSFYIKTLHLMESLDLPDPCKSGPFRDVEPGSDITHFVKVFPVARSHYGGPPENSRVEPPRSLISPTGPFDRALAGRMEPSVSYHPGSGLTRSRNGLEPPQPLLSAPMHPPLRSEPSYERGGGFMMGGSGYGPPPPSMRSRLFGPPEGSSPMMGGGGFGTRPRFPIQRGKRGGGGRPMKGERKTKMPKDSSGWKGGGGGRRFNPKDTAYVGGPSKQNKAQDFAEDDPMGTGSFAVSSAPIMK